MTTTTRTPEAEGLDVVIVGSFNPAIFHPEWFLRHKLIGEEDAKEAEGISTQEVHVRWAGAEPDPQIFHRHRVVSFSS